MGFNKTEPADVVLQWWPSLGPTSVHRRECVLFRSGLCPFFTQRFRGMEPAPAWQREGLVFKSCVNKDLLHHVLLRVSSESREFSKVCLLLKLVFMVISLIFLLLNFFLLIDLILGPLLHLFREERFKVLLLVLKLGG